MANKTNDDIYDILSDLVTILKQQNSSNNSTGHGVKSVGSERIFTTLSHDLKDFKSAVAEFQKIQAKYDRQVTNNSNPDKQYNQSMDKLIRELNELNSTKSDEQVKFNADPEYIKSYHKTLLEQNSIMEDITTRKFNLAKLEEQLANDRLKVERAELAAREKHANEIEKANKELNKQLTNQKYSLSQQRQETAKTISQMAEARGKNWGLNNKGKETSFSELLTGLSKAISAPRVALQTQSVGRLAVKGAANLIQGTSNIAKTVQGGKMDVSGMADKASEALSKAGPYGAAAAGIIQILKTAFEMYSKVDKAASDYARSVGGGRYAQDKMRMSAAELATQMSKLGKTAYLAEEILERMSQASEAFGRNLEGLSTNDLRSLKDLNNFGIDDQTIAQFDTFGVSVHNVSKQVAELYGESGKRGLNAKATIKAFTSNLKMAQNYTFARGQKALMDMAMKSAQLKFNLRDAEQFANKVSTLEGAMTAGAQLSVLGGNFAMQGNPLAMMYNGLNDVEGLQEQMLAMTKGMARWDSKKGQLDITAFDRERLKAMSQATGIDYSDLTSQAFNQARVDRVSKQLGGGFSKDEEEYIKNLASLDEKGNAYIRVGEKEYSMNDIRNNKDDVRTKLKSESEAKDTKEGADLGDVWSSTRSIQDKLDDFIKWMQGKFMNVIIKMAASVTGKDENALKYGFEGEDLKRYNKMKRFLDDKNLSQRELNRKLRKGKIDEEGRKILIEQGIINENNELIKNPKYKRYSDKKTFSHAKTAEIIGQYNMMHHNEQKKAIGGFISGIGGPTEDAIPARLSNGEFVVNAEATTRFRPLLERINSGVKNGANLMKHTPVGEFAGRMMDKVMGNQKIDVSPIKIEFGTLELKIGDLSRVLDSNEVASRLLNNSAFVDNIVKEIGIRANFGYRKDDSSNKFLDSPFVRSF